MSLFKSVYIKILFIFFIFIIIFIIVSLILQFFLYLNFIKLEQLKFLLVLTFLIPTFLIFLINKTKVKFNFKENYLIFLTIIPIAFSIQILGTAFMVWFIQYLPENIVQYYEELQKFLTPKSSVELIFSIISIGIIGPICEEYIFRGIFLTKLIEEKKNKIISNLFQSFLFGMAHMNLIQFFYAVPIGIFLGWIYIKSKNLLIPILIHIFTNISAFVFIAFEFNHPIWKTLEKFGEENISFYDLPKEPIYLSFILMVIMIYLIKKIYK